MNTMIAGSSGALTVFALNYMMTKQYSLVMLCNGNLAGLVSITGSCDNVEAWAAFVIGLIGGIVYIGSAKLVHWCRIDDPVDAVPIHGVGLILI
jgi:Amt family ammonium transporter